MTMQQASAPVVLVTRAQPGCDETVARLGSLGYAAISTPAIRLEPVFPPPPLDLTGLQGLVFTSANGVRFFAERCDERDIMAWCVGPATLAATEAAGFAEARSADGNADDLRDLIVRHGAPAVGRLLHVANAAAAGNLVRELRAAGFDTDFAGLYAPHPAMDFSVPAREALDRGTVRAVLFHSAKGADAFAPLAGGVDLSSTLAVAVSGKALGSAAALGWKQVAVAERPNEDALIQRLQALVPRV